MDNSQQQDSEQPSKRQCLRNETGQPSGLSGGHPNEKVQPVDSSGGWKENAGEENEANPSLRENPVIDGRSYTMRPARVLVSVEEFVSCKCASEMLQSLCLRVGLMVTFHVYSTESGLICCLNANRYDLVFIHQTLIYGKQGDYLILNLRCLLSYTPVIVMGLSSNYASLMSLCDFTAFLRVPFTSADFLHYILKYVFEPYESKIFQTDLQKIPKKRRLRFDVMRLLNAKNPGPAPQVVGIPVQVDYQKRKAEGLYVNTSQFNIPDCFQIPLTPSDAAQPKKTFASGQVVLNPPDPADPAEPDETEEYIAFDPLQGDMLQNLIVPFEDKAPKKRVSAGMKLVRENIDLFVEESTELLSRMKMYNITSFPQPLVPFDKSKARQYVSIAPRK